MLPKNQNYRIYPSVTLADTPTEMVIVPTERAFLLVEGKEYELTLVDVNGDELDYHSPLSHKHIKATAHGGVLKFTYTFEGEAEHIVVLHIDEKRKEKLPLFSLYPDLYETIPLKGDLHTHSFRSDGQRDPAALAGHMREQGYDFFALTDHNRFYPGGEIDEVYSGVKLGITRIRGEELHAPGAVFHTVHIGGSSSVAEIYVHDRQRYESELEEYMTRVPESIPEQFKKRYAIAMWTTDHVHKAGGFAIFPHPFWRPASDVQNVCDELTEILLTSGLFDGYELAGGNGGFPGVNRSVAMWQELRASRGLSMPIVGSSDVHNIEKDWTFPHLYTVCFAKDNSHDAIMEAVRKGNTVVVEDVGDENDRQYRCYGSWRLVTFAQFLFNHYFPQKQRICAGEGIAMRSYAIGEVDAAAIELQVKQTENFRDRFFGKLPPVLPSAKMLEFEDKWRAVHLEKGPHTKGSDIDTAKITRQI